MYDTICTIMEEKDRKNCPFYEQHCLRYCSLNQRITYPASPTEPAEAADSLKECPDYDKLINDHADLIADSRKHLESETDEEAWLDSLRGNNSRD